MAVNTDSYIKTLKSYIALYNLSFDDEVLYKVVRHTELVLEKNKVLNLTAIKDMDKALILHSLDSLLFLKETTLQEALRAPKTKVLDLGTGGGFPGVPIACCGFSDVTLIDSVGKKVKACQEFVNQLGLENSIICVHDRFEDYAKTHQREYDFVVARAVAPLDILIEYAEPLIKQNGYLVFSKGTPDTQEQNNANKVAKICGFKNVSRETFELPKDFGHRELFTYRKVTRSEVKLPRRNGEARNKPLAEQ